MNGMCLQPVSAPQDADDATDNMLFRDNITWSKGRLRRAKAMSAILGSKTVAVTAVTDNSIVVHVEQWDRCVIKAWNRNRQGNTKTKTRMRANAQRDGRPAECRWCPLFNAAKFGWCHILECRAVTLPRRETRWNLLGCPKLANRSQPLVRRNPPYFEACGETLLFNKFFPDCQCVPYLRRYSPTKLCDGA